MNILSWNIMSGGFSSYDSKDKSTERLNLLIEKIKFIGADFVSLVDTHRWTEVFTPTDLIKISGYKNVFMVKLDDERLKIKGHDNGVAVLTNLPVKKFETIRLFNRNAIKTSLEGLDIITTYLDDVSEDTRLLQCDSLLSQITANVPTIITGDLNTIDKDDATKARKEIDRMYTNHPEAMAMEPVLQGMLRGEVTKKIKACGYVDLGVGKGNTVPSKLFPIKINEPITRFDYGFASSDIKVDDFKVLKDEEFDRLSDHFPILIQVSTK